MTFHDKILLAWGILPLGFNALTANHDRLLSQMIYTSDVNSRVTHIKKSLWLLSRYCTKSWTHWISFEDFTYCFQNLRQSCGAAGHISKSLKWYKNYEVLLFNTLCLEQNGCYFADDILNLFSWKKISVLWFEFHRSLFVRVHLDMSSLLQVMGCHLTGHKSLTEAILTKISDTIMVTIF